MRIGLPVSAISHGALIVLGMIGLGSTPPFNPELVESISIDLVPVEAFSNIRAGVETSTIIETPTPSLVDADVPAELADPTGNTEEDQPTPQATPDPTPAPTIRTAPEPEPLPEPVPQIEPAPEPVAPEPEPEPVAPEPELVAPQTSETPQVSAPQPVARSAALDQARTVFLKRQEAERERMAEQRRLEEAEKAREADRISDIINAEQSRGATTGAGGEASAGKPAGQAARLTRSERDALVAQMRKCWSPPLAAIDQGIIVQLLVTLARDGSVAGRPQVISPVTSPLAGAAAGAAQRGVQRCGPYRLSADKYDEWREIDVTFDPRDIL